ncbi:DinI-like family protein [Moellerella wisconsensis]|uniref:DinI-like family protein n=1 Tax=Moellerella wisconsensis TaxID=158849 RepID=UPI0030767FCF
MLRIEILFDRTPPQKPSSEIISALQSEIKRKLKSQYPDMVTRIALSSSAAMNISGTKLDRDKERIQEIIEDIWSDDSWLSEVN